MAVHVFGVRHHGPGSARSLCQALQDLQPDAILVEGPPDADAILPFVGHSDMQPPVAILVYQPQEPWQAVYYPFAVFSPEWQAIAFALQHDIPVQFMDLPVARQLALEKHGGVTAPDIRQDPLDYMAQAAGYDDGERWWEQLVEERRDSAALFEGIAEVMTAVRDELTAPDGAADSDEVRLEARREAHMRQTIRRAIRRGHTTIAVVCGAWHVPALRRMPTARDDAALLKGMAKLPVKATWIPWTHSRLTLASGYGAGIRAPGWYHHLWQVQDQVAVRWLTRVARLLREQGLDTSSAHLIEAARLADTLAALRGRPLPGLAELNEATQTVLLFGESLPLRLIDEQLIVGESLGAVPPATPETPLQQDLQRQQKRLRLKVAATARELILDLRQPLDLDRSCLLRRLHLLAIPWGQGGERARSKGTFKESWHLQWQPEFAIKLIEAGAWGNTIQQAAVRLAVHTARHTTDLPALTKLARAVMFANLPEAVGAIMHRLQAEAAGASDITHLMQALPELAQLLRYGDVRQTETASVQHVVNGLVARICVGLPVACMALNAEAAAAMFEHLQATHGAMTLLDDAAHLHAWYQTLQRIAEQAGLPALLQGRCCRLLLERGLLSGQAAARRFSLALSLANEPFQAAAWIDGFLRGSGQILIYDETLWGLIDTWVAELSDTSFVELLPLLRRTFANFTPPERRQMGERARQDGVLPPAGSRGDGTEFDRGRADAVLPLLVNLLGLEARG